jgi:hypothetical protein
VDGGHLVNVAIRSPLRRRPDLYVVCSQDGFSFRPLYAGGKCPLCGEPAPGGEPSLPWLLRVDRFWLGLAALVLCSLAMAALVLFTYFRG